MTFGGLVLCGGRSGRMGLPKWALPFGPETMLQRVVRLLAESVSPIVVVAAPQQILRDLPVDVRIVRDCREGRGPLEGLHAGLSALPEECDAAFATGCDVPLLRPAFVRRMTELLGQHDVAVPVVHGRHHPLAAIYRRRVVGPIETLLAADRLRPVLLLDLVPARRVSAEELAEVDPELATLYNLNCPADYLTALARAGLTAPAEVLARLVAKPDKTQGPS
jgi:molybdopterin-guanine dinucleotide biosynthesis protein A